MDRKKYNKKGRAVVHTDIDDTETKKIKLDLKVDGHYDTSNELVLPSIKRKTKIKKDKSVTTKILSKKVRKRLEKIVEKKNKKQNRASLLETLAQVKANPEELNKLTSIASIQTKGLKKYFHEQKYPQKKIPKVDADILAGDVKINSLSGSKRKRLELLSNRNSSNDINVVAFDESSSEDEGNEENVQHDNVNKIKDNRQEVESKNDLVESKDNSEAIKIIPAEDPIKNHAKAANITNTEVKKVLKESKPAIFISVDRLEDIQMARLKLPILAEEQEIMETINENSVIIIAGETGSGKTTQIPQFLYEAGYALEKMIAVTEPRRVAAISMAKRVGEELNLPNDVSYLIRFEGNVTDQTKIKFMTDGVLLREIQKDFLLMNYSVIILDEAHERSVYTDILIGLLSRIVPLRCKKGIQLKLLIMSATLRLEDFTENVRLFKTPPPVIKVEARQFPVTIHFNKRTNENYLKEAYSKAIKVHTKLPEGGILIFVTGQQELNTLVRKLRRTFPIKNKHVAKEQLEEEVEKSLDKSLRKRQKVKFLPKVNLDDYGLPGDVEDLKISDDEIESEGSDTELDTNSNSNSEPLWVLPLYSLLPSQKQQEVFKPPPAGCRLCVVSTNVAETSLTIPNIKYVIDTGKSKVKMYDKITGVTTYFVTWTSKASADQRAGRAGRTGPGHCFRLYSSAIYNDTFEKFTIPEIQQKPVDDLYLQMKCMNIDKVVNFPFPTAPDLLQLRSAESRLETLGALKNGVVTPLGRAISKFPVLPRFGKMLALSHQQDLLPYTICMVAALSVQEVLLEVPIHPVSAEVLKGLRQKWMIIRRQWAGVGNSLFLGDPMVLIRGVGAAEYANSEGKLESFCEDNGLRQKAVIEIRKLRIQLTNEIRANVENIDISVDAKLSPPSDLQAKLLRQILLSGMGDQVARKVMLEELKENDDKAKFKYAYRANNMEDPVFLHQGSVLKKTLPEFVVYQEIYETNKMYMRGVTAIEPEWLVKYVPHVCNLTEPLADPQPRYDPISGKVFCTVTGTFGTQAWPLPNVEVEYPNNENSYRWFASFLLEGVVFPKLAKYKSSLLSTPSTMVKSWARLKARTGVILRELIDSNSNSKKALENCWRTTPSYLLKEYLNWLPESAHGEVKLLWPPTE